MSNSALLLTLTQCPISVTSIRLLPRISFLDMPSLLGQIGLSTFLLAQMNTVSKFRELLKQRTWSHGNFVTV
jgi:hypothetical protein